MQRAFGSLGAMFLAATLTGCQYEIVDCSPEQSDFINASLAWMKVQETNLDKKMDETFVPTVTAHEIVTAVSGSDIQCGIGRSKDAVPATSWSVPERQIVLDIEDPSVKYDLSLFADTRWVVDPEAADDNPADPVAQTVRYNMALSDLAMLLGHESAHFLLGDHTQEVKQEVNDLVETGNASPKATSQVDEIYAWGYANYALAR